MNSTLILAIVAALLLLGLVAVSIILSIRSKKWQRERSEWTSTHGYLSARIEELTAEKSALEASLKTKEEELRHLTALNAQVQTTLEIQKQQQIEAQQQLETTQKHMREQFENLSNRILEHQSSRFSESSKQNLEQLLKPLGQQLESYKKTIEAAHLEDTKQRSSLDERIKWLVAQTNQVSAQAQNLAQALTGQSKVQGNFGEVILERILEQSGLIKDLHYRVQETFQSEQGRILRPDVIIKLPNQRAIVIDSKMSLTAYDRFCAATQPEVQQAELTQHVRSVRAHVDELSAKPYQEYEDSLDMVFLFIPIEPAFLCALQADPSLWEDAYKKRILLLSPTTLIATLKLFNELWARDAQNKNALEIARRGTLLYDKFAGFVETLQNVGAAIDKSKEHYDKALQQLSEGRGNLLRQAQDLQTLGIKSAKKLPLKDTPPETPLA